MDNIILGKNIKEIRKKLGLTQEELAEKLDVNFQYLSKVENGKVGISIDNAIKICKIAGCSSVCLFKDILKSPNTNDQYELLEERDKSIIDQMIVYLLNTK